MYELWASLLWAAAFFAGASWFSFMNTVAGRLLQGLSPWHGRSRCEACGHILGAAELVPVFSWLLLRGRCRHCGAPIPRRELLAELLGGAAALACRRRYGAAFALRDGLLGLSWSALAALAVCGLLTAIALIDAGTMLIPDSLLLALGAAAAGRLFFAPGPWAEVLPAHLAGALCVSLPMALLCLAVPGAFGSGDIWLMAAAGLLLGWRHTLLAFLIALLGGGGWGLYLLLHRRIGPGDHFAFAPFLCAGIAAAMLSGDGILLWYRLGICAFFSSAGV